MTTSQKPFDPDELVHLVSNAIATAAPREKLYAQREPTADLSGDLTNRAKPQMKRVVELVETVAPTDATVLITGESGTGKEVVARAIHPASHGGYNPMVVIHCGALTETLPRERIVWPRKRRVHRCSGTQEGKFEMAEGGTVFLDEISDITCGHRLTCCGCSGKEIVRVG